ncbi:MAG: hypothetical protein LH702_18695 [Phormidesmis sp. CAN_BIN44]|nr:hypothetical protein [Phormidesmis sp. CAN_BIN44]
MATCYVLQDNIEQALANLRRSIDLNAELRESALTDSAFNNLRKAEEFKTLTATVER